MPALLTEGCLRNHPFLTGADCAFLNHLEEFARPVLFEPGDMIFSQGEYADRCYLILDGKVQLEARSNGFPRMFIQTLGAGDMLDWSWLYPPFEWDCSARALERCEAVELNAASLLIRAEEDSTFGYELMKRVSMQLVRRLQTSRNRLAREIRRREGSD